VGNEKQGLGTGGLGTWDEALPAAGACQHHPLNLFCGSIKPTNLKKNSFLAEPCGDVYENKGSAYHWRSQSRNVIENKGSYTFIAGMLVKRKVVSRW
jgi:hypothetical protein